MKLKWTYSLIAGLMLGLLISGCGPVVGGGPAGENTYVHNDGWVEETYQAGLNDTYEACLKTAEEMGMAVESTTLTAMTGEIKAVKAGEDYWFKLTEKPGNLATLSIKVGMTGNKDISETVHKNMASRL